MIWILVAHRAQARLFRTPTRGGQIQLIRELSYPEGRRQNREIDTDAKGSRYSISAGRRNALGGRGSPSSQMKHGLDPQLEAEEHLADIFAKELALILREGRTRNECEEIVLVAESGFLGKLRRFMDKTTAHMVSVSLDRNLAVLSVPDLVKKLKPLLEPFRRRAA